jgi:glycosyltransferase involved in cell wall biosynthesis
MSVRVTIGLCVKDSERTIKESIESIIGQKYPGELIQLVIVDGCSRDKTLSIVASATSKTDLIVETYSDKGEGLGTARQIVVNNARGKYVIFADADVRLFSDFVKSHVEFMEENPGIGVAFGTPMHQEGTSLVAAIWSLCDCVVGGSVGNDATIYRSEVLRQVGGFDTKIKGAGEDRELIARFRLNGWPVSVNETARYFHKHRENFRGFWVEQSWFGYGDHYVSHKDKNGKPKWHNLPIGSFVYGLRIAVKAYRLTHRKISFLIPVQLVLAKISWWYGFIRGHLEGYGHETKRAYTCSRL